MSHPLSLWLLLLLIHLGVSGCLLLSSVSPVRRPAKCPVRLGGLRLLRARPSGLSRMELSRAIVCASLRQVYSLHGRCGPPTGAFLTPRSSPTVVGVLVPFAWSSCLRRGDGLGNWALLHLLQEVRRCCISRALRPRQQEWVEGWVRRNDTLVRGLPILVGGASLVAVLLNRAVSGIAAVADASRSACACEHPELMRFGCTNHLFCSPP
jgi:hypothetical protein